MSAIDRVRDDLVAWYLGGHRDLPWRRTVDPYAIWVSEIMLQQTRVETVAPRFSRWLDRFPSVSALAGAPLDEVLAEWAGLGYYARARNLHAAAREVAERYGGALPDDPAAIRALPGIGRYTAGAILSLAFGRREPILDGNVVRVLTRLYRIGDDPRAAKTQARLWALATVLVGAGDPSHVNQGLMELGATVCRPRRPSCDVCPLHRRCEAHRAGDAASYPAPTRAQRVTALDQVAVALLRRGKVLLCRRPPRGLWGGLYELPTGAPEDGELPVDAAARVARERVGLTIGAALPLCRFPHLLSHRRVTFHAFVAGKVTGAVRRAGYDAHRFVTTDEARALGISRATSRMLDALDAAALARPATVRR